jgi:hypothetical protein
MLTVARATTLSLQVSKEEDSSNHIVSGKLESYINPHGIEDKIITIKINETTTGDYYEENVTTDNNGEFDLPRTFKALESGTANYLISAMFAGEYGGHVEAWAKTPDGSSYAVCTTDQWNYKASATSTSLSVKPQATHATNQTKTQEEMQEEAESEGWLTVWHEFNWWYPWYRVHIQINVNPRIHVGFNPILPGGETADWERLEIFGAIMAEVVQEIIVDAIGLFAGYFAAKLLSIWNPAVGIIAEAVKGSLQFALLVANEWNDKIGLLASSIVSFIMGFIALKVEIGKAFIETLYHLISGAASAALTDLSWKLLHVIFVAQFTGRWWLDYVDAAINWFIGSIALVRYLTMG